MTSTSAVAAAGAANPDRTVIPVGIWAKRTVRFAIAVSVAFVLSWLAYGALPSKLSVRTDIVGFPIHSNYLPQRLLYVYAVWVVIAPLLALGFYVLLGRLVPWFARPSRRTVRLRLARTPEAVEAWSVRAQATDWARVVLVGLVLGVELTMAADSRRPLVLGAAVVVQLVVVAAGGRLIATRLGVSPTRARGLANALTATLGFLGLWLVSRSTAVSVPSTGTIDRYPWMPLWLAILGTVALATAVVVFARRDPTDRGLARVERTVLLLLVGPLVIFLVVGGISGEPGLFNPFEEGQLLAGAQFLIDGLVPWRDMFLTHGVLQDALVDLPGLLLFGESRWGAFAGTSLLMLPLAWIGNYYLAVYVLRRNVLLLCGTIALLVVGHGFIGGLMTEVMIRFLLLPYALLLFALLLKRPSWPRAAGFTAVLFVQVVLAPELTIAVPVFAAVLVAFEWTARAPGTALRSSFPRVARCAVAGLGCTAALAVVLVAIDALGAFIEYFTTFVGSHFLTGAIPVQGYESTDFKIAMYLPIAMVLVSFWYVVARFRSGRGLRVVEWVMTADAALVLVYYTKFLVRADPGHVVQVFAVAVPLVYYVVYRVIGSIEQLLLRARTGRTAARFVGPHWVTAIVLLAILVPNVDGLVDTAEQAPTAFRPTVANEPFDPRMGYTDLIPRGEGRPDSNLRQVLDAIEGRSGRVWDFSNSIATVSFLLHEPLVTRYPHVTIAEQQQAQADLVDELRAERPEVVVYDSYNGLGSWDGIPNQVRHYEVSSYLLEHYHPFVSIDGYLLYVRNDLKPSRKSIEELPLTSTPVFDDLYFAPGPCDWGTAPHFFDQQPSGTRRSQPLTTRPGPRVVEIVGVVPASIDGAQVTEILAVDDDARVVGHGDTGRPRIDLPPAEDGNFAREFGLGTPVLGSRVYARLDDDTLVQLAAPDAAEVDNSAASWTSVQDGDTSLAVRPLRRVGLVEHTQRRQSLEIDLPEDATSYDWLELTSDGPLAPDQFDLTDTGSPLRSISFRTLPDGDDRYRVRVGGCATWRGYPNGATVLLLHDADQSIERVQLLS